MPKEQCCLCYSSIRTSRLTGFEFLTYLQNDQEKETSGMTIKRHQITKTLLLGPMETSPRGIWGCYSTSRTYKGWRQAYHPWLVILPKEASGISSRLTTSPWGQVYLVVTDEACDGGCRQCPLGTLNFVSKTSWTGYSKEDKSEGRSEEANTQS